MKPTLQWLKHAEKIIYKTLRGLTPKLLEAQGKIEHHLKVNKSVVTEIDLLVESKLQEKLQKFDSGIGFAGEEMGADYDQKTYWLVDPIDGTEAFIRGLPFATNMIALIDGGEPVMGIVNNFGLNEYFLAVKGHGSTMNGHPISVSDRSLKRSYVIYGGRGPDTKKCSHNELRKIVAGQVRINASGYELCSVARGATEAIVTINARSKPWDFAPGTLIIREAGGKVANIGSKRYDFTNTDLIASNKVVFDDLMKYFVEEYSLKVTR